MTATRKLLVLLDDVAQAAQVKPLLPAGAGSVVVVTSNSHLEELVYEGAELITVDPLDEEASEELLARMTGAARIDGEPEEVANLISMCDGLPVALCLCGAKLRTRRDVSVAWLVAQIADEAERLERLSAGSEHSVQQVFDFAYADLAPAASLLYRRLGLAGPDFTPAQAAALTDFTVTEAREILEFLRDAHLVEPVTEGRYRVHELIRLHMRECLNRDDPPKPRGHAARQLVNWYYAALGRADRAVVANRLRLAPDERIEVPALPEFADSRQAFLWFEEERGNLISALRTALEHGFDDRVWELAEGLWLFYYNHKHYADWIESTEAGAESARRLGNDAAEARMLAQLARAHVDLREFDLALSLLTRAKEAALISENEQLQASVIEFVGICRLDQGEYDMALERLREARELFQARREFRGAAIQDYNIGLALIRKGEPEAAFPPLDQALATMRHAGDEANLGRILLHRGRARKATGDLEAAQRDFEESIKVMVPLGARFEEAEAYEELAGLAESRQQKVEAAAHLRSAYRIYLALGHPRAADLASTA